MQRKVVLLRDAKKLTWPQIASAVRNLQKKKPSERTVRRYYGALSRLCGRVRTKYANCGRTATKVTKAVETLIVKRLRALRTKMVCTARTLQHEVARATGTNVSRSSVQRVLKTMGYKWLAKRQKRKYSARARAARVDFAKKALRFGVAELKQRLALAMDGVVLTMPPVDPTDRLNFCRQGEPRMWRKPAEGLSPALAGDDPFGKQVPLTRAVPLWGGCSSKGFAAVLFHATKKLTVPEWRRAVDRGLLTKALLRLKSQKKSGKFHVLCDNESFLRAAAVNVAHKKAHVQLWKIPPKSPDLNPVERFWSWLRQKLRAMDLADAVAKRRALTKPKYVARVKRVLRSKKAQAVAAACATGFRKVCKEVVAKKGAATHG